MAVSSVFDRALNQLVFFAACLGMGLLVLQVLWIDYGVFARYVMGRPDRYVTEATALMLVALVFLGLPLAYRSDVIPRVAMFTEALPPGPRRAIKLFNQVVILLVGAFFSYMALSATVRTYQSGARSDVVGWPEYTVWAPLAFSIALFTVMVTRDLLSSGVAGRKQGQSK